jgi:hypothetical protein
MEPVKVATLGAVALLASTALASATVVTQVETYSATTNWGTSGSNTSNFIPDYTLNFAGFDAAVAGGNLNSITIILTGAVSGALTFTNSGTSSTAVNGQLENSLEVDFPGGTLATSTSGVGPNKKTTTYNYDQLFQVKTDELSETVAGKVGNTPGSFGPVKVSASASNAIFTSSNSATLSEYLGAWSVSVGDLGQVLTGSGNGNGSVSFNDIGSVTVTASYSYTGGTVINTPEPATLAVLGTGLFGLGVVRRRRQSL